MQLVKHGTELLILGRFSTLLVAQYVLLNFREALETLTLLLSVIIMDQIIQ